MKIAVCDDVRLVREQIISLIKRQMRDCEIVSFSSGEEMMSSGEDFEICFLDIALGEMSGIALARYIRKNQERTGACRSILIFVTNYREYMGEAFDVNAFHYLLKPIHEEKFAEVFSRAVKEAEYRIQHETKSILIKCSDAKRRLMLKDIFYIESNNKKVIFQTKGGAVEAYAKMADLEKMLHSVFFRCHRCYLVNLEMISGYTSNQIELINGDRLLLAEKKYSDFVKSYLRYARNGGIVNV